MIDSTCQPERAADRHGDRGGSTQLPDLAACSSVAFRGPANSVNTGCEAFNGRLKRSDSNATRHAPDVSDKVTLSIEVEAFKR
jgi:hypothetical protein